MQDVVELPAEVYRKIIRHCLKGLSTPTITGVSKYDRWNEVIGALIGTFKPGKVEIEDAIELGEGLSYLESDPDRRVRKYTHWALERLRAKSL